MEKEMLEQYSKIDSIKEKEQIEELKDIFNKIKQGQYARFLSKCQCRLTMLGRCILL